MMVLSEKLLELADIAEVEVNSTNIPFEKVKSSGVCLPSNRGVHPQNQTYTRKDQAGGIKKMKGVVVRAKENTET